MQRNFFNCFNMLSVCVRILTIVTGR
ncbi:hypothetical protein CBM2586_A110010 [Cupriavidus phytorum]|uniref:Uncharacterized protein n=1 Tax=Cupriavidus taiwanensis TaxID=164546 RepID=A0A375BZZ8_9BURK|nr:hypothetical protein CBM2586_A110010 [Cupriavidus taiwanensis]